ncbi:MAG TPA: sialate O-acetylesterase, partial [Puia sp.]
GVARKIVLEKDFSGGGVTVIRVKAVDAAGNAVPVADNEVFFDVSGPARIIGVGNGDPVSHEADLSIEKVLLLPVGRLQAKVVTDGSGDGYTETGGAGWHGNLEKITDDTTAAVAAYKGDIDLPELPDGSVCRLFYKSIGKGQRVYLNGQLIGRPVDGAERSEFKVDSSILRKGKNELVIIARPFRKRYRWDNVNYDPGVLQLVVPAERWKRRLFNGLAQVIVEGTGKAGDVTLTAVSEGLEGDGIQIVKSRDSAGRSTVSLPGVFGNNMVLQRGIAIPVWGRAHPGAEVIGKLGTKVATAKADRAGKWMLHFPEMAAGGPYMLEIAEQGKPGTRVEFKNILIGDVWVASGQSNMEWQVQQANNAQQEISQASYPDMRYLIVEHDKGVTPQTDLVTRGWEACDTNSVKRLSAVAYFFARKIHRDEHVPVGIIQAAWGGTPIQAWTSRDKLASSPITKDGLRATDTLSETQFVQDSINTVHFWDVIARPQNGSDKVIPTPDYDDSGWARVEMPRTLDHFGIGSYEGIMWLRKKVVLPDAFAGRALVLALGHPEVNYSLYFNGVEICKNVWNAPPGHSYPIPANLVRKGENTVAIRMAMLWGAGGLEPPAEGMYLSNGDARISLAGEWRYNKDLEPVPPLHNYQYYPTVLFNAMLNPLIPYGISGIIWYQGEANAGEAYDYRKLFPMMIADWRERWNRRDLPFLFAQLANFMDRKPVPSESAWAELREAQAMALSLPRTAMACTIDIGDGANIHPADKQDVGLRLALGAENLVYGKHGIASGPMYKSYSVGGNRMVIRFSGVGSGLTTRDGKPIAGFAIAGDDRQWHWADAVVEGNDVVVHSDQVAKPLAARYAWADNPDCNLMNKEGLPAVPFRTDDWKGITQRKD